MTSAPPSDALKNLVIFIIVLAVAATIVALLAWYFAVELPAQQVVLTALNDATDFCQLTTPTYNEKKFGQSVSCVWDTP